MTLIKQQVGLTITYSEYTINSAITPNSNMVNECLQQNINAYCLGFDFTLKIVQKLLRYKSKIKHNIASTTTDFI